LRGVVADLPLSQSVEDNAWFTTFVESDALRLREALLARFGLDVGCEVWEDTVTWAWEHRARVREITNRVGYLYRVAQSASRRYVRWNNRIALVPIDDLLVDEGREVDLDLVDALESLRRDQRVAVTLVHAYGWSYAEVADLLGISIAATTNHVHRGLRRLRTLLED
jgi:DNA-directed RNA polymerase specialized sigma24 family protein